MKAKDTVMTMEQIKGCWAHAGLKPCDYVVAEAQAEISFKAGIKEVVAGISEIIGKLQVGHPEPKAGADHSFEPSYYMIDTRDWQAKLKEWGIDE